MPLPVAERTLCAPIWELPDIDKVASRDSWNRPLLPGGIALLARSTRTAYERDAYGEADAGAADLAILLSRPCRASSILAAGFSSSLTILLPSLLSCFNCKFSTSLGIDAEYFPHQSICNLLDQLCPLCSACPLVGHLLSSLSCPRMNANIDSSPLYSRLRIASYARYALVQHVVLELQRSALRAVTSVPSSVDREMGN